MKIGGVTIGQSPRVDVTPDILPIFGEDVELLETGALDGLTREEIEQMKPKEDDYVLVSRLNDGSYAKFGESFILERLQGCIEKLEAEGVELIMFFCGGTFPDVFKAHVPLIYPSGLLNGVAKGLSPRSKIILITPDKEQIQQAYDQWGSVVKTLHPVAANPYGDIQEVIDAANAVKDIDADLVVMDCIGYTERSKKLVKEITGKPVIMCRTLLARVVCEMLDIS
ncbi:AroM family protein [Mediterraneibacter massiliensis]|uniref:AroM family protein n=1 Tax=Mediterraneibacter massiliensis TaxID=1720300 RepID=UPI0022E0AC0E|nr:AroM family protein [Mediterraneibacter massiliensis]